MNANPKSAKRRFQRCYFVYILANLKGLLYVGLTDDLCKRMLQHKSGFFDGFTKKYKVHRLMYLETYSDSKIAAAREKQIKKFRREKKIALFVGSNLSWKDLTSEIFQSIGVPRYARDSRKTHTEEIDFNSEYSHL
ncbi:MAG TPA: GIY-YIG nuclease family protein [Candidatus Angelobacter sp.]|nr:GIY-YIG nuclease family protein [Candidatus Angelobacter sp.]